MNQPPPYPKTTGYEPCAVSDPELFFPERRNAFIKNTETAKALCRSCPVLSDCLNYALHTDVDGIWGATDEVERKKIRKEKGIEPFKFTKFLALLIEEYLN